MSKFVKKISSWSPEAKTGLVLSLAATVVLGGVLLFESNAVRDDYDDSISTSGNPNTSSNGGNNNSTPNPGTSDDPVVQQEESFVKPFTVETTISRYYYDMSYDKETREQAIVELSTGKSTKYIKSVGVDYTYTGGEFNVVASLSGTVQDIISDPTYGEMVCIMHDHDIMTIYASLKNVKVKEGDEVKQGATIGTSGESTYTAGLGSSLHFEVLKESKHLNPEKIYSTLISNI